MAISRGQLAKELEPGLNALFGLEYKNYENQHLEIFDKESSDRAFEEDLLALSKKDLPSVMTMRKRLSLHVTLMRQLLSLFLLLKKQLRITCMTVLAHAILKR
jgi:hypothetical protein